MTRTDRFSLLAAIALVCAAFAPNLLRAQEQEQGLAEQAIQRAQEAVEAAQQTAQQRARDSMQRARQALIFDVETAGRLSEYYVGLQCDPIDDVLRSHLRLGKDQGLLVRFVMPDSPAATAGVEPNDIVLQFGEAKVGQIDQLFDAVEANKDAEAAVKLLRAGKPKTLKITPAKRTEKVTRGMIRRNPEMRDLSKMFEGLEGSEKDPLRLRFFHPGIVIEGRKEAHKHLPADVQVVIVKAGDGPTKVTVKKGDKTWEVTADSLDELPAEIAGHVKGLLGRNLPEGIDARAFRWFGRKDAEAPAEGDVEIEIEPGTPQVPQAVGAEKALQRQLEQMQKQLQQMQKQLEEMGAEGDE